MDLARRSFQPQRTLLYLKADALAVFKGSLVRRNKQRNDYLSWSGSIGRWMGEVQFTSVSTDPTKHSDPHFFYHMLSVHTFRHLTLQGDTLNASPELRKQSLTVLAFKSSGACRSINFLRHWLGVWWKRSGADPKQWLSSEWITPPSSSTWRDGGYHTFPPGHGRGGRWIYVSHKERPIDTDELQPEITFYNYNSDRNLNKIAEEGVMGNFTTSLNAWQSLTSTQTFDNNGWEAQYDWRQSTTGDGGMVDRSLCLNQLVFWTSCATVSFQVSLEHQSADYKIDGDIIKREDSGEQTLVRGFYYEPAIIETESADTSSVEVTRDFIIIGRSLAEPDWAPWPHRTMGWWESV